MAYPPVHIMNSTHYGAAGTVVYPSALCSNDRYTVYPEQEWTASGRGYCLVTEINAKLGLGDGVTYWATPYKSSGTSYSQFAIIQTKENPPEFSVTRVITAGDEPPADYVEPTENQNF